MADANNHPVIFLAFANDRDDTVGYLRNLPDEARRLRDVLQPAEQAGLCEVVVRSNSTVDDILKVFQDPKYRNRVGIFHYGGHANGYQLLLESAAGQTAAADAGGLAKFLGQQQGLELVFLNGCSTQQQTDGLLDANISAVISTSRAIDDQVATDFSHQFYQGLAGGATIRTAYNEAEAAVQTAKGGDTRSLYFGDKDKSESQLVADRWPWNLYLREGSETADRWNLPEAVNDPLFGLPPLPEQDLPESPYRHLNWFTRKDAEVFFGRGHQIRELHDRLTAPRTAPIMLFYGQSGVGKSSILDAGLIPRLEQDYEVRYLRRTEAGLLDTLGLAFLPEAAGEPIETAWRAKEEQTGKPLIVFLDQVEELYTRPNAAVPDELDQLLKVVKATFIESDQRPRGKLVLGFRKEWLAELEAQLVDHELPRTKVFLEPLDRRGIIEVVQGPSRSERLRERYGLAVEDGLAEVIADDLLADRDSAVAPTLQILLTKMWTKATEENYEQPQFSQAVYQHLKRDGILLRDFLNQQIESFREQYPEVVDSGLLLDIVALHTTPLGTADQRTVEHLQEQYAHLDATLPELLQQCQNLHLLTVATSAQKENAKATRLAHDTLAPLVREQFDVSDKPGQRARRILDNRSVDWKLDREGTPLDEADLKIVDEGLVGTRDLNPTENRLLEASRKLQAKLQRTRKTLKIAATAAVVVIVAAFGFASVMWLEAAQARDKEEIARKDADVKKQEAVEAQNEAVKTRDEARIQLGRNLWNSAIAARDAFHDPLRASHYFMLAAVEFEKSPSDSRDAQLAGDMLVRNTELLAVFDHAEGAVFNKDETRVLTRGSNSDAWKSGWIQIWEADSGKLLTERKYAGGVRSASFSSDETRVLSWGSLAIGFSGWIEVFDANTGKVIGLREHRGSSWEDCRFVEGAELSKDGSRVLSWGTFGRAEVWKSEGGELIAEYDHETAVAGAIFNKDASRVLSWDRGGLTKVWDANTGEEIASCRNDASVSGATFNKDETRVLSWGNDGLVQVLDVDFDEVICKREPKGEIEGVGAVFSADGARVLSSTSWTNKLMGESVVGQLELWETKNNDENNLVSFDFPATIGGAKLSNDDSRILVWSDRGQQLLQLLDVASGDTLIDQTFQQINGQVMGATFSDDNARVLAWGGGQDGGWVQVFDADDEKPIIDADRDKTIVHKHPGRVNGAIFNKDATCVLSWGSDGSVQLWNVATGEVIAGIRHEGGMMDAVFSKDETCVLSTGGSSVQLWRAKSREVTHEIKHPDIDGAVFNPDGSQVLSWGMNYQSGRFSVRLWNANNSEPFSESNQNGKIGGAGFRDEKAQVLSWTDDGSVRLWQPKSGQVIHQWEFPGIRRASLSQDGKNVLCWNEKGSVQLWNAETGESIAAGNNLLSVSDSGETGAVASADGTRILGWWFDHENNQNIAQLWMTKDGKLIAGPKHRFLIGNGGAVFSSDGARILSWCFNESKAQLWDADSGQVLAEYEHATQISRALFSKDEKRVLSSSLDGTVRLWAVSGQLIAETRQPAEVWGAVFSQDESRVLSWNEYDGSAYLWDVATDYDRPRESFSLEVEVLTGTRLDQGLNKVIALSRDEWLERKTELEKLSGPRNISR